MVQKGRLGEAQQLVADCGFAEQLGPVGLLPGGQIIPADRNPHIHITEAVGLTPGKAAAQPHGMHVLAPGQGSGGVGDGANLGQIRQAGQDSGERLRHENDTLALHTGLGHCTASPSSME